jgi:hypothetical protein
VKNGLLGDLKDLSSFFDGLTADEPQLDYLRSSGIQSHEAGQRILQRGECRP